MIPARALVADDEQDIRELLRITLTRMGIDCRAAPDLAAARRFLPTETFDLCLTDMRLPDGNGIDLVRQIASQFPQMPVAMITAHGSMDSAVAAMKAGAFDFVSKPVDLQVLRRLVEAALRLRAPVAEQGVAQDRPALLGESPTMVELRRLITKLARNQAPVYVSGESGTGKELAARLIHLLGPRAGAPFVPVNCGAIPPDLVESELFGHRKGAFTGAIADNPGLFKAADGGTLFLDEVAELPLPAQVKLLRVLQEKKARPVGGHREVPIDVRLISATHRDLAALGLEALVGLTRGSLQTTFGRAEAAIDRLALELTGYYLLGFEPEASDRDGKAHAIAVKVSRPGVTIRARRQFIAPVASGVVTAALLLLVAVFLVLSYNRILLLGVHEGFARTKGVHVRALEVSFAVMTALVVTTAIRTVGILLVTALLVIPAASARNLARGAASAFLISVGIAVLSVFSGLVASYYLDTATGATVVLAAAACFALTAATRAVRPNG